MTAPGSMLMLAMLTIALLSGVCTAQVASTPKQKKLVELLGLMRFDQAYLISKKGCVDAAVNGPFSPRKIAARDGDYYGFTPKSPAWPAVLRAYERYALASCSPMPLAEARKRYLDFYGSRVSERDLDALLKFLRTPSGRAFASVQDDFLRALGGETQRRTLAGAAEAQVVLDRDLAKLKQPPSAGPIK